MIIYYWKVNYHTLPEKGKEGEEACQIALHIHMLQVQHAKKELPPIHNLEKLRPWRGPSGM